MTRTIEFFKHNAIALAALFIALGGTSYAAVAIPRNSVGARQLRKGAVTSQKIHSGAITPGKLASGAFGAEVRYLAQIAAGGVVTGSYPKGVTTADWTAGVGGIVNLPRKLPAGCFVIAGAGTAGLNSNNSVGADLENRSQVQIQTTPSVTAVNLEILCER